MTARYSVLAVDCGLKLHEILRLSPRQIAEIYFHKRKEDGTPVVEAQSGSRLAVLLSLAQSGLVKATPEQVAELQRRLKGGGDPGGHPKPA